MTLVGVLGWVLVPAAHAVLVNNGGFETGDFTGWTTVSAASGSNYGITANAHSGATSSYFRADRSDDDRIFQTLTTVAGESYDVEFWIWNGLSPMHFAAKWGGNTFFELTDSPSSVWMLQQFTLVASGSSTVLEFSGRNFRGISLLDDISVTPVAPVPEPSTIIAGALLLVPLGAGLIRHHSRRKA
ncbi:MAG: hypothetical protein L0387_42790 [Acidobacteria bacterium]|nr:hypothetical protein [Acidobacteriota bacterium]